MAHKNSVVSSQVAGPLNYRPIDAGLDVEIEKDTQHHYGIEVGEDGYMVCDEVSHICPVQGVQEWSMALEYQKILSGKVDDEMSADA